jgi:hypothetical protein
MTQPAQPAQPAVVAQIHVEPKCPAPTAVSLTLALTPQEEALAQAIADIVKDMAANLRTTDENRNRAARQQ